MGFGFGFIAKGAAAGPPPTLVVNGATVVQNTSNLTAYSFTGQSVGTASSDRYLVVAAATRGGTVNDTVSITLNGGAQNPVGSVSKGGATSTTATQVGLALFAIPTGTTVEIDVTTASGGVCGRCTIAFWVVTGRVTTATIDQIGVNGSLSNNIASSLGGATFIATSTRTAASNSFTIQGTTPEYDNLSGTGTSALQEAGAKFTSNDGNPFNAQTSGGSSPSAVAFSIG